MENKNIEEKNAKEMENIMETMKELMLVDMYDYKRVLTGMSAYEAAAVALREVGFNVVLGNTAKKTNVYPDRITFLRNEFDEFVNASKITITENSTNKVESHSWTFHKFKYEWEFSEWIQTMLNLVTYLVETGAWYEDTTSSGFCYKGRNGHHYVVSHE